MKTEFDQNSLSKKWILLYFLPLRMPDKTAHRTIVALDLFLFLIFISNVNLIKNSLLFYFLFGVGLLHVVLGINSLRKGKSIKMLRTMFIVRLIYLAINGIYIVYSIVLTSSGTERILQILTEDYKMNVAALDLKAYLNSVVVFQSVAAFFNLVHLLWSVTLFRLCGWVSNK